MRIDLHFLIYLLFISTLLGACTINEVGPPGVDGVSDRQIRFPLGEATQTSASQDTVLIDARYNLIKFDKRNYVDVDSIVFSSRMRAQIDEDTCIVRLYNVSSDSFISTATLMSDTTVFEWVDSPNIFGALPSSEIELGVQLISKRDGAIVEGGQAYLFLYRSDN